ncbi:hypothetical protein ACIP4W_29770 [Streptomyces sp. NPDC088846]|uniref:hypothetical protein n=1 Tax=Streptomyces sp. NPDC088846 TaxID=3365908 RepID=UPI003808EA36
MLSDRSTVGLKVGRLGLALAAVRDLREFRGPVSAEELEQFETDVLAWGQLPGRFCCGCYAYGQQHAVGECAGCRRQVPVDDKHSYCRLCRAQATWAIKASGKASVIEPYLRHVTCQQLFFANLQRPRNGGPSVGEAGRRVLRRLPLPDPSHMITEWMQLTLFTATRDFRRFDRERHADLADPWLVRAWKAARAQGEARGWSRWIASDVNRALVIVLSGYREGEPIRYSDGPASAFARRRRSWCRVAKYALRKAMDRTELDARRHVAKEASVAFVAAAATLLSPNNR